MSEFPDPKTLLAHRAPFLFVDEIVDLDPGKSAAAVWHLTGDEPFFAGHFPGRPTLPGVLMIEALAQTGACGLLSDPDLAHKLPLLVGANKTKFRRQVVPGETLRLQADMTQLSARAGKSVCKATVDGELACQAEITFVLVEQ